MTKNSTARELVNMNNNLNGLLIPCVELQV
jgi:hypothetical protein